MSLSEYVDARQSSGHYNFTRQAFLASSSMSASTFVVAASRLEKKHRIIKPIRGFYVIIPLEYSAIGQLPATWYIDDLMRYLGINYYVGLLSAAALHGAGHHQPQSFQLVTDKQHRNICIGKHDIHFLSTQKFNTRQSQDQKTDTGYMKVASPEQTAVDLVQFYKASGHFNHIVTVLSELAEQLDSDRLLLCVKNVGIAHAQRLGYLINFSGNESLTKPLYDWVKKKAKQYVLLNPAGEKKTC